LPEDRRSHAAATHTRTVLPLHPRPEQEWGCAAEKGWTERVEEAEGRGNAKATGREARRRGSQVGKVKLSMFIRARQGGLHSPPQVILKPCIASMQYSRSARMPVERFDSSTSTVARAR
jgi:hypothetical protein